MEFHEAAKRRSTSRAERLISCECCGYPLSQRHHLLPVAEYEENELTLHLCANCHEKYHLIYGAYIEERQGCRELLGLLYLKTGVNTPDPHFDWLRDKAHEAKELQREWDKEAMRIARERLEGGR